MANNNKHTGPNVPALRFPEFSGEWESRTIGDDCKILMCKRIFANQTTSEGEVPFYKIGTIGDKADAYISKKLFEEYKQRYNYPKCGEVMITCAGTVGKTILYNGQDAYYQDSNIVWISNPRKIYSNEFLNYLLNRVDWSKLNSTTITRIYNDNLRELHITFPSREEQDKIVSLLTRIDDRIDTQSKIIEELKTLRGALVDTYINDGNNNNENQTIMSLGAYGCFVRGLTYSSVDVTDNTATTGVVRSNNLEYGSPVDIKADLVYVTKKPSPEQMLVNGDIVICMANGSSSLVGKASNYQELCRNMTVGAFCGIYRGTHPLTKWIFMSSAYCKALANAIQGGNGAIANLHAEDILSMCFAVPSDYKTITELGKLLSLFDEKLHAAEEQLARFIEQKKYFLFKMFI